MNKIETLIFLYRYTFYAFLKDAFGERVRMLNTDIDSFFLHFFVEDIAKEINSRPHFRDAFDFSEISNGHLSNLTRCHADLHAGEMCYFKDETKGNPIVEFVGLRPKMYLFTVCDAAEPIPGVNYPMDMRHKAVAKGVARSQIKRFKHEDYVRMCNGGALINVVNRRIGSKLHQVRLIIYILICMTVNLSICLQVFTMETEKRYSARTTTNGTCLPTCLMVARIRTLTPTATVIWRLRSTLWPTSQSLVRSSSFGTPRSDWPGDTPA